MTPLGNSCMESSVHFDNTDYWSRISVTPLAYCCTHSSVHFYCVLAELYKNMSDVTKCENISQINTKFILY